MDAWARAEAYGGRVSFVCVSCAGPDLAAAFVAELRLSECYGGI